MDGRASKDAAIISQWQDFAVQNRELLVDFQLSARIE